MLDTALTFVQFTNASKRGEGDRVNSSYSTLHFDNRENSYLFAIALRCLSFIVVSRSVQDELGVFIYSVRASEI